MKSVKTSELRNLNSGEIETKLADAREELMKLRFQQVTGQLTDTSRLRIIRRATVLVRDGMIRTVGSETPIPASAQIVDGKGKTLLPGLFDAHTHLGVFLAEQFLRDGLAFGITTELEMGGEQYNPCAKEKDVRRRICGQSGFPHGGHGHCRSEGSPDADGGPSHADTRGR